ncbi:RagB/SusD family nutrient uptake outer membrane protein [Flavivirga amylovorans]|uniref:RagB/SusD family nutrient uptake outer membrane protein n=1 Tax=Flavivirga amylovorans TaxID=870486 RepID=A0ABT8WWW6_9FLAO|nr:RagB/SusD family nutrient uptake outer membrane protein [Flavivirga amylovorans]MDO5986179.1 RagB/SusD family nutrient uptake outer membrane protein [Flavivirga amylovorans]
MKKIIILLTLTVVWTTFYSCDEYLDVENPNSTVTNSDPQNLLFAAYAELQDEDVLGIAFESLRSDVGRIGPLVTSNANDFPYTTFYNQDISNPAIDERLEGKWNAHYKGILQANVTLDRLNQLEEENGSLTEVQEYQKAQARCLRGMYHFFLHSVFNEGKIIIQDAPVVLNTAFKSLSTSQEVIDFFRADLEYAFENLFEAEDTANGFVSKGFAATLLGKSYLYEGNYTQAIQWLTNPSIQGQYSLLSGNAAVNMFSESQEFSNESIFELAYNVNDLTGESILGNTTNHVTRETAPPTAVRFRRPTLRVNDISGGGQGVSYLTPPYWLTIAYTSEEIDPTDNRNTVNGELRPVSLRTSAMIAVPQDIITEYYERDFAALAVFFGRGYASFYKKYTNHDIIDQEIPGNNNRELRSGKNIMVARYAEVVLMLAECYIEENMLPEAVTEIESIRSRWGLRSLTDIGVDVNSQEALRNHLRFVEKPLELSAEGFSIRAIDLRRWGIGSARYADLQARSYNFTEFTFEVPDGQTAPTPQIDNLIVEDPSGDFIDYDGISYDTTNNGWLPLPQQERTLNNNID